MKQDVSSWGTIGINRKKPFKVMVCAVTLVAFLFNIISYDLAWAVRTPLELTHVGPDRADSPGFVKELKFDSFKLPAYLGYVRDADKGLSPKGTVPIVIHIQDAHCNYAAQNAISNIIEYLNREYGIRQINLEGGEGEYDFSPFNKIQDVSIKRKVADYFLKEGEINGAEYFAINNPDKVALWGVEDTDLYLDNLNVYRGSLQYKEEIDKSLKSLSNYIANLKVKLYSKELLALDQKGIDFKTKALEFKDYVEYLTGISKGWNIDIQDLKNLDILNKTLSLEKGIDFKKSNLERDQLIDKLNKSFSKNELTELVGKAFEFKSGHLQPIEFYSYLIGKTKEVNIDIAEYKDLTLYIGYVSLYATLKKEEIIKEIEALEDRIKEKFYQNDAQRELNKLSKYFNIIKNILSITLTQEEFKYYKAHEDEFAIDNFINFIKAHSQKNGLNLPMNGDLKNLDSDLKEMERFYALSYKRDEEFVKNLKGLSPKGTTPEASILITGGFHTENLTSLLKKRGISYISIMPNFGLDDRECPYFKLLAGNNSGLLKFIIANMSTMAIYAYFSENAERIYGEPALRAKEDWIAVVSSLLEGKESPMINGIVYFVLSEEKPLLKEGEKIVDEVPEAVINGKQIYAIWVGEKPVTVKLAIPPSLDRLRVELLKALEGGMPGVITYLNSKVGNKDVMEHLLSLTSNIEQYLKIDPNLLLIHEKIEILAIRLGLSKEEAHSFTDDFVKEFIHIDDKKSVFADRMPLVEFMPGGTNVFALRYVKEQNRPAEIKIYLSNKEWIEIKDVLTLGNNWVSINNAILLEGWQLDYYEKKIEKGEPLGEIESFQYRHTKMLKNLYNNKFESREKRREILLSWQEFVSKAVLLYEQELEEAELRKKGEARRRRIEEQQKPAPLAMKLPMGGAPTLITLATQKRYGHLSKWGLGWVAAIVEFFQSLAPVSFIRAHGEKQTAGELIPRIIGIVGIWSAMLALPFITSAGLAGHTDISMIIVFILSLAAGAAGNVLAHGVYNTLANLFHFAPLMLNNRQRSLFDQAYLEGDTLLPQLLDQRINEIRKHFADDFIGMNGLNNKGVTLLRGYNLNRNQAYLVELTNGLSPFANIIVIVNKETGYISNIYIGRPITVSLQVAWYRALKNKESLPNLEGEDFIELNKDLDIASKEFVAQLKDKIMELLKNGQQIEKLAVKTEKEGAQSKRWDWQVLTAPEKFTLLRSIARETWRSGSIAKAIRHLLTLPAARGFGITKGMLFLKAKNVEGGHYRHANKLIFMLVLDRSVSGETFIHELGHHIFEQLNPEMQAKIIEYFSKKFSNMEILLKHPLYRDHLLSFAMNQFFGREQESKIPEGVISELFAFTLASLITDTSPVLEGFKVTKADMEFLKEQGFLPEDFTKTDFDDMDNEIAEEEFWSFIKKEALDYSMEEFVGSRSQNQKTEEEKAAGKFFQEMIGRLIEARKDLALIGQPRLPDQIKYQDLRPQLIQHSPERVMPQLNQNIQLIQPEKAQYNYAVVKIPLWLKFVFALQENKIEVQKRFRNAVRNNERAYRSIGADINNPITRQAIINAALHEAFTNYSATEPPAGVSLSNTPLTPHFGAPPNDVDWQFIEAQRAIQGGNFDEASKLVKEAVRLLREVDFEALTDDGLPIADRVNDVKLAIEVLEQLKANGRLDDDGQKLLALLKKDVNGEDLKQALRKIEPSPISFISSEGEGVDIGFAQAKAKETAKIHSLNLAAFVANPIPRSILGYGQPDETDGMPVSVTDRDLYFYTIDGKNRYSCFLVEKTGASTQIYVSRKVHEILSETKKGRLLYSKIVKMLNGERDAAFTTAENVLYKEALKRVVDYAVSDKETKIVKVTEEGASPLWRKISVVDQLLMGQIKITPFKDIDAGTENRRKKVKYAILNKTMIEEAEIRDLSKDDYVALIHAINDTISKELSLYKRIELFLDYALPLYQVAISHEKASIDLYNTVVSCALSVDKNLIRDRSINSLLTHSLRKIGINGFLKWYYLNFLELFSLRRKIEFLVNNGFCIDILINLAGTRSYAISRRLNSIEIWRRGSKDCRVQIRGERVGKINRNYEPVGWGRLDQPEAAIYLDQFHYFGIGDSRSAKKSVENFVKTHEIEHAVGPRSSMLHRLIKIIEIVPLSFIKNFILLILPDEVFEEEKAFLGGIARISSKNFIKILRAYISHRHVIDGEGLLMPDRDPHYIAWIRIVNGFFRKLGVKNNDGTFYAMPEIDPRKIPAIKKFIKEIRDVEKLLILVDANTESAVKALRNLAPRYLSALGIKSAEEIDEAINSDNVAKKPREIIEFLKRNMENELLDLFEKPINTLEEALGEKEELKKKGLNYRRIVKDLYRELTGEEFVISTKRSTEKMLPQKPVLKRTLSREEDPAKAVFPTGAPIKEIKEIEIVDASKKDTLVKGKIEPAPGRVVAGAKGKESLERVIDIGGLKDFTMDKPFYFGPKDAENPEGRYKVEDGKIKMGDLEIKVKEFSEMKDIKENVIEDDGVVVKTKDGKFFILIRAGPGVSEERMKEAFHHELIAALSLLGAVTAKDEIALIHEMAKFTLPKDEITELEKTKHLGANQGLIVAAQPAPITGAMPESDDAMMAKIREIFAQRLGKDSRKFEELNQRYAIRAVRGGLNEGEKRRLTGEILGVLEDAPLFMTVEPYGKGYPVRIKNTFIHSNEMNLDTHPFSYFYLVHELIEVGIVEQLFALNLNQKDPVMPTKDIHNLTVLEYTNWKTYIETQQRADEYGLNFNERALNALMFFEIAGEILLDGKTQDIADILQKTPFAEEFQGDFALFMFLKKMAKERLRVLFKKPPLGKGKALSDIIQELDDNDKEFLIEIMEQFVQMRSMAKIVKVEKEGVPTPEGVASSAPAAGMLEPVQHRVANEYIKKNLPKDLIDKPENIKNYKQVEGVVEGVRVTARVIPIEGLLKATRQFAHIGLGQVYGEPVIYIDADYDGNSTVIDHELFEIAKWEEKREKLGLEPHQMRQWILDNYYEARTLADNWHREAPSLNSLFIDLLKSAGVEVKELAEGVSYYVREDGIFVIAAPEPIVTKLVGDVAGKAISGKFLLSHRSEGIVPSELGREDRVVILNMNSKAKSLEEILAHEIRHHRHDERMAKDSESSRKMMAIEYIVNKLWEDIKLRDLNLELWNDIKIYLETIGGYSAPIAAREVAVDEVIPFDKAIEMKDIFMSVGVKRFFIDTKDQEDRLRKEQEKLRDMVFAARKERLDRQRALEGIEDIYPEERDLNLAAGIPATEVESLYWVKEFIDKINSIDYEKAIELTARIIKAIEQHDARLRYDLIVALGKDEPIKEVISYVERGQLDKSEFTKAVREVLSTEDRYADVSDAAAAAGESYIKGLTKPTPHLSDKDKPNRFRYLLHRISLQTTDLAKEAEVLKTSIISASLVDGKRIAYSDFGPTGFIVEPHLYDSIIYAHLDGRGMNGLKQVNYPFYINGLKVIKKYAGIPDADDILEKTSQDRYNEVLIEGSEIKGVFIQPFAERLYPGAVSDIIEFAIRNGLDIVVLPREGPSYDNTNKFVERQMEERFKSLTAQPALPIPHPEAASQQREAARELLGTVRFPGEPRIFFIPVEGYDVFKAHLERVKSETKHELKDFKITIIYYDGTEKGLREAYDKAKTELKESGALALAYIKDGQYEMAQEIFKGDNRVKYIQERLEHGYNIKDIALHVVLGLGILDFVRTESLKNGSLDKYDIWKLLNLLETMGDAESNKAMIDRLRGLDAAKKVYELIFSRLFFFIPKAERVDINNIPKMIERELEFLRSL